MSNDTKGLVKVTATEGYKTADGTIHPLDSQLTLPWLQAKHAAGINQVKIISKIEA